MTGHDCRCHPDRCAQLHKNREGKRDLEIHQAKKDNQWYFGMKIYICVDKDSGIIYSVGATVANVHDLTPSS